MGIAYLGGAALHNARDGRMEGVGRWCIGRCQVRRGQDGGEVRAVVAGPGCRAARAWRR